MTEKRVLLVRHPTVVWTSELLSRAEKDGLDVETYVPLDKEGLKMGMLLADYLVRTLGAQIEGSLIFTSPIERARTLAEIFFAWVYAENNAAFPKDIIVADCFAEIPWKSTREAAEGIIARSKIEGRSFLLLEFEGDPAGNASRYNNYLHRNIKPALKVLEASAALLVFVFSHSAFIGALLWAIEQVSKRGQTLGSLTVTQEDLPGIADKVMAISQTSISEIYQTPEGWRISSIGQRPHLEGTALMGRTQFE